MARVCSYQPSHIRGKRDDSLSRTKMSIVYTIGHSAHPYDKFAGNLEQNKIEVLVDVRSSPYSKYCPQFDRELMSRSLQESGMKYLFLGSELGGRPEKAGYYDGQGRAVYGRMISDPAFISGIERLERGITEFKVAIMCGEEDPTHCHRRLLVGRVLAERGHIVMHIRADGRTQSDAQLVVESGKELINAQPALFAEIDEDQWRSTVSVSPKKARGNSSRS